ncbi:actin filament-associated protein 1-like 2 isoform X3 [Tursiops truncatus]|uniref:actin filament-associated protein 1-like 2 isoform X3 n=1 Tax=Tursiops truncatus TaxID=9739 RepID=UPI003CCF66C0
MKILLKPFSTSESVLLCTKDRRCLGPAALHSYKERKGGLSPDWPSCMLLALEQLLTELDDFLRILDQENLSSTAVVKKSGLAELLRLYTKSSRPSSQDCRWSWEPLTYQLDGVENQHLVKHGLQSVQGGRRSLVTRPVPAFSAIYRSPSCGGSTCSESNSSDEEYIYMNKVTVHKQQDAESQDKAPEEQSPLTNGEPSQHSSAPQKSLPDLPPPKIIPERKQLSTPKIESPEGYYEEAEPYDTSLNEDGEAVSSSYESYDEDESSKGKSAPYQWPSPEASIELMRDARICAFLWRKKWLGQWAKQLCVIKDTRLLCYKSSKDHSPQLDVNLLGSSVVHKEKQVRKKEHKLKITPVSADVIVLGLQSKDQAEQWLRVIQEVSGLPSEGACEGSQYTPDAQRPSCPKKTEVRVNLEIPSHWGEKQGLSLKSQHTRFPGQPDVTEKYLSASDYGSSIDGHPEVPETKDVKKKCSAGLKLSNLMNLGRKKSTSLEPPERSLETTSYLNVLVNSQWKSRWCSVRDSHLYFYQDRNRSKAAQQPLSLVGCEVVPDPSPDHLYSFRILHDGEELAKLEAKSSEEMGHWLGLLLSESGSKTDPEEFTYDYVDADRVSCIVSAAKTSLLLMQRKFSEPNTYIDGLPSQHHQELLYDDVEVSELTAVGEAPEEAAPATDAPSEPDSDRVYLDLTPVKSFLHGTGGAQARAPSPTLPQPDPPAEALPADLNPTPDEPLMVSPENPELQVQGAPQQVSWPHLLGCLGQLGPVCFLPKQMQQESQEPEEPSLGITAVKIQTEQQKISFPPSCPDTVPITPAGASPPVKDRLKATNAEIKLGKNRTEAEVKRYTEEKERLEKKKEEIRGHLAQLRREKRELKETLLKCTADWLLSADKGAAASLEEKLKEIDEECRVEECRRVDLELSIVEVKDSLKKAEAGPVTLGTTVDTTHLENVSPRPKAATSTPAPDCTPVNSATALKNRPLSVMVTGKGTVLQKAKEWEKKGAS